jgi:hypothetical protein
VQLWPPPIFELLRGITRALQENCSYICGGHIFYEDEIPGLLSVSIIIQRLISKDTVYKEGNDTSPPLTDCLMP